MRYSFLPRKTFEHIDFERDLIVCASAKLAEELRYSHNHSQVARGNLSWPTPLITTYGTWLSDTYRGLSGSLWEHGSRTLIDDGVLTLIAESCAPEADVATHARLMVDAWNLVWDWQLTTEWESVQQTQNGRLLSTWFRRLQRRLKSDNLITRAEVPATLLSAIREGRLERCVTHFFGFESPTRSQQQIFNALERNDYPIQMLNENEVGEEHGAWVSFDSPQTELTVLATWVREKLSKLGPTARIGVVVQDLGNRRAKIRRQFESTFPEIDEIDRLVYVAGGASIANSGYWRDFTTFLTWITDELRFTDIQRLGLSPHFEKLEIPSSIQPWYKAKMSFAYFARRTRNPAMFQISQRLNELRQRRRRPIGSVIRDLGEVLQPLDWSSLEVHPALFEERRNMVSVLNEVASMGGLLQTTTFRNIGDLIRFTAENTSAQGGRSEAPVHVISRDQSKFLKFDALWVCNSSDSEWPEEPSPNPFIPIAVQREARMPGATHSDLLESAKRRMAHWFGATNDLVFSYCNDDEESENQLSALLNNIVETSLDAILDQPEIAEHAHPWWQSRQYTSTESYFDDHGSKLKRTKPTKTSTSVLSDQLVCPFRAWGIQRMGVGDTMHPTRFLNPAEKGTVIHEVISQLAPAGTNKDALREVDPNTIAEQVERNIRRFHRGLPRFYIDSETAHLVELIQDWIEFELEQEDFEVIAAESKQPIVLGNAKFEVRIDRIDRTEGLSYRISDYKTGKAGIGSWVPDNLMDPQMPLYSLTHDDCDALRYIRIHDPEKEGKSGISSSFIQHGQDGALVHSRLAKAEINEKTFAELKLRWQSQLTQLVEDFHAGNAQVRPVKPTVCDQCHLGGFCRIYTRHTLPSDLESDQDE